MAEKRKVELITVGELIVALAKQPKEAKVYLFSDAEGNDCQPLDYLGVDGRGANKKIILVPMHGGWDR